MFKAKFSIFLYIFHFSNCDWVAEWMAPVQEKLAASISQKGIDDEVLRMVQVNPGSDSETKPVYTVPKVNQHDTVSLKTKLEDSLVNAEDLIEKLQIQIGVLEKKERMLKEAITNGRSGVSTVTVSTIGQPSRSYFIRDGAWYTCRGMVQFPKGGQSASLALNTVFTAPRCIGQEISTQRDPCTFNSVIKYETVPEHRTLQYLEEDYFCLKPVFNRSLEQFLSVPKRIIKDTCKQGIVRSLAENTEQCGIRMISEYSYYPRRTQAVASLPLEYCTEKDGSCRLIVAWHMSNATVENFEFLKNEVNFKKYFVNSGGPYVEREM